jgi:hypothetical protein
MTQKILKLGLVIVCMMAVTVSQVLVDDNYSQYVDNTIPEPILVTIQK